MSKKWLFVLVLVLLLISSLSFQKILEIPFIHFDVFAQENTKTNFTPSQNQPEVIIDFDNNKHKLVMSLKNTTRLDYQIEYWHQVDNQLVKEAIQKKDIQIFDSFPNKQLIKEINRHKESIPFYTQSGDDVVPHQIKKAVLKIDLTNHQNDEFEYQASFRFDQDFIMTVEKQSLTPKTTLIENFGKEIDQFIQESKQKSKNVIVGTQLKLQNLFPKDKITSLENLDQFKVQILNAAYDKKTRQKVVTGWITLKENKQTTQYEVGDTELQNYQVNVYYTEFHQEENINEKLLNDKVPTVTKQELIGSTSLQLVEWNSFQSHILFHSNKNHLKEVG